MSASRAGRNAEPVSLVRLALIRRPMISPRSMQQAVHRLVDAVDLAAQLGERGRRRGRDLGRAHLFNLYGHLALCRGGHIDRVGDPQKQRKH